MGLGAIWHLLNINVFEAFFDECWDGESLKVPVAELCVLVEAPAVDLERL